jgi:hypothetical protein
MPGGSITVSNGAGDALSVTITGGTWKAAADLSGSNVSFPDAITASKTYYTGTDRDGIVISVKRRGLEIAGTPDGTRTVNIQDGKNLTFSPGPDPAKAIAAGEVYEAASGAVNVPEIAVDGDGDEIAPANDEFAIGVDADGDLAFYDGSAWVKVALDGHTHGE